MICEHNIEPVQPVVTSLHEIVAFNMKAFGDMTEARRAFIWSDLNMEFKDVLGDRNPAAEKWLGGEDLRQVMDDIKKGAKSADMLKKNQKKKDSPAKGKGHGFDPNFRYPGHPSYQSGRGRGYHPYANNDYFRGGQS